MGRCGRGGPEPNGNEITTAFGEALGADTAWFDADGSYALLFGAEEEALEKCEAITSFVEVWEIESSAVKAQIFAALKREAPDVWEFRGGIEGCLYDSATEAADTYRLALDDLALDAD